MGRSFFAAVCTWCATSASGASSGLAPLPDSVMALLARSASERRLEHVETPTLGTLHRRYIDLPKSCEVLVAISASSVNPADTSTPGPFPQVMGSDLAGSVLAVEPACQRLRVGDKVWADIGAVTKVRQTMAKGKENGAYAQVAIALESQLGKMPANLGYAEAAALPKVALTSYKALQWYGGAPYTKENGSILILGGSGGTGTAGIQLAKAYGASRIVTTTSAENFDYVKSLGATEVINYRTTNWTDVIGDRSVDVIYDCVGIPGTGDQAMTKLKSGGFYVTLRGALPSSLRPDVTSTAFINSDTNLNNVDVLDALRRLVETNQLRMRRLTPYNFSRIEAAFEESSKGHVVGKLSINMPPLSNETVTSQETMVVSL